MIHLPHTVKSVKIGSYIQRKSQSGRPDNQNKTDAGYASIYLTSPADNDVLIRAELYSVKTVYDESTGQATFFPDKLLGKTGFIRPGTYVEKVRVKGLRSGENTKVMVKIPTMYEESGTSKGIFYIRTTVN